VEGTHPRGPLPLDAALHLAAQLAGALGAAHERGIVHGDLKPANIIVGSNGAIKILDFGVARRGDLVLAGSTATDVLGSPPGAIAGTPAYMSPEQAQGHPGDRRSDIWAFGVVLFEVLTGHPLFESGSMTATLGAVLTKSVDLTQVPPRVRPLLRACLERDPDKRLHDIADAHLLLDGFESNAASVPAQSRVWVAWTICAVLAASLAVSTYEWTRDHATDPRLSMRLSVDLGPTAVDEAGLPALAPDGRTLAWAGRTGGVGSHLFLRSLDTGRDLSLEGTDGARRPFFSPDGQWIGFFIETDLWKVSVRGGAAVRIASSLATGDMGVSWGETIKSSSAAGAASACSAYRPRAAPPR
jgi:Protein kinase domain/WD40-like Beta Propeller Repeat